MDSTVKIYHGNYILALLPEIVADNLLPMMEHVSLAEGTILIEPHKPVPHVHFLLTGLAARIGATTHGEMEIGLIGREGLSGSSTLLGATQSPYSTSMQIAGSALQIETTDLVSLSNNCETLRNILLRYVQIRSVQVAATMLAATKFNIEERTARWLLMCHDRLEGSLLPLTHDFLGHMLGVRRAGITNAIHILEGLKCIRATRGWIEVRDRATLEQIAGDSYGAPEAEYTRLLSPWRKVGA